MNIGNTVALEEHSNVSACLKNHSEIYNRTNLPKTFHSKYMNSCAKRKVLLDSEKAELVDLKNIMTCYRNEQTSEPWVSKKVCKSENVCSFHDATDNICPVAVVKRDQLSMYSSLLLNSGVKHDTARIMIASCCSGDDTSWPSQLSSVEGGENTSRATRNCDESSDEVCQYSLQMNQNRLQWRQDLENVFSSTTSPHPTLDEAASPFTPLRRPATACSAVVRNQLHLMEDHCLTWRRPAAVDSESTLEQPNSGTRNIGLCSSGTPLSSAQRSLAEVSSRCPVPMCAQINIDLAQTADLQSALARHSEAMSDSVLEMVSVSFAGPL